MRSKLFQEGRLQTDDVAPEGIPPKKENEMGIWKHKLTIEGLQSTCVNTLVDHLGIEFTRIGEDFIEAKMPVDKRTFQPMRLLHGGASVALAETLGSVASVGCIEDISKHAPVGVEINANHIRSGRSGFVYGIVKPIKIGRRMHVWEIKIRDEQEKLLCVSRLTVSIIEISPT